MQKHSTALVIGAGFGGIAAAARLAQQGYKVTVVEKNARPGGRCDQIIRDGHRFDIGPTLFLMPEVFAETYSALGERMEDHLDLRRIDPTYRIHFEDGKELSLTSDLNQLQSQVEAIEPGSFAALMRYMAEGYLHYHTSLERFVGRNFYNLLDYFSLQNLPLLFKLKALVKHYDSIGHYFQDPHLKQAFTFQNMYLGLSPYDAPATYSLLQYTELAGGVWFPMGGLYKVVENLVTIAEGLGVRFLYNAPVQRIDVDDRRARGVTLRDGTRLAADVVLANADLPYVYQNLLPPDRKVKQLENLRYTSSAIMFYWGVDKEISQLDVHNVFLAKDYRESFDKIFKDHSLPDHPSFYVHAPSRVDPAAAPEGQDSLFVLVPAGHLDEGQDWNGLCNRARRSVLDRLAEIGISGLENHLKFEVTYSPRTWLQRYNLAKGAAFGLSHNFWQVGYLRPHNRHDRYENLYFVGSSTHPGTGLPMVLLSARLTVERILQEMSAPAYNRSQYQVQQSAAAHSR
ncbi:MAG: phytoene desaturase [Chloroflexi bacterium]|nr:MAG: phytoene desaturase [Chloroflexota bacterium]